LRFRCQPEFQIPPLRAARFLPKLESQAGNFILVRGNFGRTVLIHGPIINELYRTNQYI
jgi:hypothetical protein